MTGVRHYCTPVLVCGGRDYGDREFLFSYMDAVAFMYGGDIMVIHGAARGADLLAEEWAKSREQLYCGFPAQWSTLGRRAGYKRNSEMGALSGAQVVVAFRGGRGTLNMLSIAANMDEMPVVLLPCGEFWK